MPEPLKSKDKHGTLNNVVKAKLSAFFFWPLAYAGILIRMLIDKVL